MNRGSNVRIVIIMLNKKDTTINSHSSIPHSGQRGEAETMWRMRKVSAVWWKQWGEAVVTEAAAIAKRGSFKVRNIMRSRSTEVNLLETTKTTINSR